MMQAKIRTNILVRFLSAASLAGVSCAAYSLDVLDDSALSDQVAQSGLTVQTTNIPTLTPTFVYQDTDGVPVTGASAGNLSTQGLTMSVISTPASPVKITADVGSTSAKAAMLDLNLSIPGATVGLNGVSSSALGFNVLLDTCPGTSMAACTVGSGDAPLLVMPSTGSGLSMTLTGINLNLQFGSAGGQGHVGVLTDTAPLSLTLGNTAPVGLAFVNNSNVLAAGTVVGGLGVQNIAVTGVDLGEVLGTNYTYVDICSGTAGSSVGVCQSSSTPAGLALTFNGTAMTGINVQVNNITAGNIGTGGTSGGLTYTGTSSATPPPNYGSLNVVGLSLAGASLIVSGH